LISGSHPGARDGASVETDESRQAADVRNAVVAAAMRGDREASRMLWEEHRRWIAAVILAHKPVFEDLEDLLQEVAMTFVSKVNTLRCETNLRAWLRTVAINAARAAGRSGRYRPALDLGDDDVSTTDGHIDAEVTASEQARRVLERVERLPETYREPLLLRAVRGMRSRQIAQILDVPPATVDTRIARARRMLREMGAGMEEDGGESGMQVEEVHRRNGHAPSSGPRPGAGAAGAAGATSAIARSGQERDAT